MALIISNPHSKVIQTIYSVESGVWLVVYLPEQPYQCFPAVVILLVDILQTFKCLKVQKCIYAQNLHPKNDGLIILLLS